MNFDFSDEQKILRDQVRKFLADACPLTVVRRVLEGGESHAPEVWSGLADMGLAAAAIDEEYGGLGLGGLELCVTAQELGRALAPVPFSSSVYLAARALSRAGAPEQKHAWLPGLASGARIGTMALAEGPGVLAPRTITARFEDGRLNGIKTPVADGEIADLAVVLAAGPGSDGLSLVLADLSGAGVERTPVDTIDPSRGHAQVRFRDAPAELLGAAGRGWPLLQDVFNGAAVPFAFEQLGGADAVLEMARDYALERYAFGRPIGSYQAVKHRLADMFVRNELARSNCYYGAMMLKQEGADLPIAAAAARISATDAFNFAARENIQVHGGIGYTWESDCQLFYRRAKLLGLALGGARRWKDALVSHLETRNAA